MHTLNAVQAITSCMLLPYSCCSAATATKAAEAIKALRVSVETLIVSPNDKLLDGKTLKVSLGLLTAAMPGSWVKASLPGNVVMTQACDTQQQMICLHAACIIHPRSSCMQHINTWNNSVITEARLAPSKHKLTACLHIKACCCLQLLTPPCLSLKPSE